MCAIFGIIGDYDPEQAKKAFYSLEHRGPDGSSYLAEPSLFLGSHRLAITSFGTAMRQPYTEDDIHLVFNGEIYNYMPLAKELEIEDASEEAVILECYRQRGDAFVHDLRGMYAIAIVDQGILKLYRDPMGKKPLYYRYTPKGLYFASEIKALRGEERPLIDKKQIPVYLSFQSTIAPYTFYKDIYQLGAGESLLYDTRRYRIKTFDSIVESKYSIKKKSEAVALIQKRLKEAVEIRIPGRVPYATLLSGGLDSSLVAAMAAEEGPLRSYCIGYEGYEKYDERPYARETAAHIGSDHHEVIFGKEDFFQSIEDVVELLDEPLADPAILPLHYLMRHISEDGVKVVLTGDGSDELFMGYKTYMEYADLEQLASLKHKSWLKNYLKAHFSMHKEWEWHKRIFEESILFRSTAEVFTDLQQNQLLKTNIRDNHSLEAIRAYREVFEASGRKAPADWYSYLDIKVLLGELFLKKLDRVSMANGVEARTPFLDRRVVAVAFGIDADLRMGTERKHLIKSAAAEYLPKSIIERKKKGFNYPFLEWLHEENAFAVIEEVQRETGLFREVHLRYLLEKGRQGMFRQHLFSLFMLCKWIVKRQAAV